MKTLHVHRHVTIIVTAGHLVESLMRSWRVTKLIIRDLLSLWPFKFKSVYTVDAIQHEPNHTYEKKATHWQKILDYTKNVKLNLQLKYFLHITSGTN